MVCLQLDQSLENACTILQAVIVGNSIELVKYMPFLLRCIVTLLRSPLAAPRVSNSFVQLARTAFKDSDKYFGMYWSHV